MIVIYDQEKTYIRKNLEEAEAIILSLYGDKLGKEALKELVCERVGMSWRKNGGALIQVVDDEKAEWIRKKELNIGMI